MLSRLNLLIDSVEGQLFLPLGFACSAALTVESVFTEARTDGNWQSQTLPQAPNLKVESRGLESISGASQNLANAYVPLLEVRLPVTLPPQMLEKATVNLTASKNQGGWPCSESKRTLSDTQQHGVCSAKYPQGTLLQL